MQNVLGYPVLTAGLLLAARGIGTFVGMIVVGRLLKHGRGALSHLHRPRRYRRTLYQMVGFTDRHSGRTIVIIQPRPGLRPGLVFVPLNTVAFATPAGELRTDGAALLTLMRNIGSRSASRWSSRG